MYDHDDSQSIARQHLALVIDGIRGFLLADAPMVEGAGRMQSADNGLNKSMS